jgi:hypothetical protein
MLAGGAACTLCAVTRGWLQLAFAVACKVGASAALALNPVYTDELFPANVRAAAVYACSLVSLLKNPPCGEQSAVTNIWRNC